MFSGIVDSITNTAQYSAQDAVWRASNSAQDAASDAATRAARNAVEKKKSSSSNRSNSPTQSEPPAATTPAPPPSQYPAPAQQSYPPSDVPPQSYPPPGGYPPQGAYGYPPQGAPGYPPPGQYPYNQGYPSPAYPPPGAVPGPYAYPPPGQAYPPPGQYPPPAGPGQAAPPSSASPLVSWKTVSDLPRTFECYISNEHGVYLGAYAGEGKMFGSKTDKQKWEIKFQEGPYLLLRNLAVDRYVTAEKSLMSAGEVTCRCPKPNNYERWQFVDMQPGLFALRSHHNYFLMIEDGGHVKAKEKVACTLPEKSSIFRFSPC